MKYAVWIISALLALFFLFVGGMKVIASSADLAASANGIPVVMMKVAGVAEVLGALGLILPAATRIRPVLTPLAAAGLVVVMIGATIANLVTGVPMAAVQTAVVGLLCAFVAWARFTGRVGSSAPADVTPGEGKSAPGTA